MITLKKFAQQFVDDASGHIKTADSRFDLRDVMIKTRQFMNEVLNLKYYEKYQEGDKSNVSLYISTYKLTLNNDADRNLAFVTLPEFYHTLPYNRGIHRAWRKKDSDEGEYKDIVVSGQPGIGANLRAGQVAGVNYGYMEGLNLCLRNVSVDPEEEPESVYVQLIVAAPDSIGEDDNLPILPDHQAEILRRLWSLYVPVPQDLSANTNASL